jgi:hypothetical protein
MRCTVCGTENEPNSRFCGGCGAKQPASGEQARLAPTAKISDDAPYPQQAARPAVVPQGPVSYAPPSIPPTSAPRALATPPPGSLVRPQSQQPASSPPAARPVSSHPRAATRPQLSSGSESIAVPARRPIGLMVALLVVDIGLAAAGGVLLSKGLAEHEAKKTEPTPVEKKSEAQASAPDKLAASLPVPPASVPQVAARESPKREATATKPTVTTPTAKPIGSKPTTSKPATASQPKGGAPVSDKPATNPAGDKPATKPADDKPVAKPDEAKPVGGVPAQPQDPNVVPNTERELDAAATGSKAAFAACATGHPGHGSIKIAFQVRYDGRVINAAAVENTTGDPDLARCLIAEISSWRVSAHNSGTMSFVRPFTYP